MCGNWGQVTSGALKLVVGNSAVPLAEVLHSVAEGYGVGGVTIRHLVDTATTADSLYTPSNARRESDKLDTQAPHERWRKEYPGAEEEPHLEMSNIWYSQQIARMGVAKGRSAARSEST